MKLIAITTALFFSLLSYAGRCPFCDLEIPDEILDTHVLCHHEENGSSDDESIGKQKKKRERDDNADEGKATQKKKRCIEQRKITKLLDAQLIEAALNWQAENVEAILAKGADVDAQNSKGSVLFQVIRSLNDDNVQFDFDDEESRPEENAFAIIWQLLNNGVNVTDAIFELRESNDEAGIINVLNECISWHTDHETGYGESFQDILDQIISMINPKAANAHGETALAILVESGYFPGVQTLIASSADVNAKDNSGTSVLTTSLFGNGAPDIPRLLIEHGAFVDAIDLKLAIERRDDVMLESEDEQQEWADVVELMLASQTKMFMLTKLALQNAHDIPMPEDLQRFIFRNMLGL